MIILGLTGSIGMGKTVAAAMLRRLGIPVHDSDAVVHRLIGRGGAAVSQIERAFPGVVKNGAVVRELLGQRVFNDRTALLRLEALLHPLVWEAERRFLGVAARDRCKMVVLDVPLLFETQGEQRVDAVVVVTAPAFIQRQRVLARPGMTAQRLAAILARQVPDRDKRQRADFVVETGLGRAFSFRKLSAIMGRLAHRRGRHWPPPSYRPPGLRRPVV